MVVLSNPFYIKKKSWWICWSKHLRKSDIMLVYQKDILHWHLGGVVRTMVQREIKVNKVRIYGTLKLTCSHSLSWNLNQVFRIMSLHFDSISQLVRSMLQWFVFQVFQEQHMIFEFLSTCSLSAIIFMNFTYVWLVKVC